MFQFRSKSTIQNSNVYTQLNTLNLHSLYFFRYEGGTTNTAEALTFMTDQQFTAGRGDRPEVQNIGIVITDGRSNVAPANTVPNAVRAQAAGIRVYAIGITNDVSEEELRQISSSPQIQGQNYFLAPEFTDLGTLVSTLTQQTCGAVDVGKFTREP